MNEIILASPLFLIGVLTLIIFVIDTLTKNNKELVYITALISIGIPIVASIYLIFNAYDFLPNINCQSTWLKNSLVFSYYTYFFDTIFCLSGLMTLLASNHYLKKEYKVYSEYYLLIIISIFGMMLISHSNHLLILFIGIEIMSISFYALAGYIRDRKSSTEAALKYFLLGAFSTGFLVYGIAMLYGSTGSMNYTEIIQITRTSAYNALYFSISIGLLIVGFSFKIAAFPFHQWAPDVYHGSPTVVSGFMSTAGKAAAIIGFLTVFRMVYQSIDNTIVINNIIENGRLIIAVISAITMLIGNISALVQKNIKRMLAYSSIAHAGYMMMGIVANNQMGWSAIAFYSFIYMFMQLAAFIIVSIIENNNSNLEITDYSGLKSNHPYLAAMMSIYMFSLAGLPPFAGFWGKYFLFIASIQAGYTWLAIIAIIGSIISMYFYIGLIIQMYFKENHNDNIKPNNYTLPTISLIISTLAILFFGIYPSILFEFTNKIF